MNEAEVYATHKVRELTHSLSTPEAIQRAQHLEWLDAARRSAAHVERIEQSPATPSRVPYPW